MEVPLETDWINIVAERSEITTTCQFCPVVPYISLALPEPSESGKRLAVRRIVFTITSHDQGWSSSHPDKKGSYFDTQTFFEVHVNDTHGSTEFVSEDICSNRRAVQESYTHQVSWDSRPHHSRDFMGNVITLHPAASRSPSNSLARMRSGHVISLVPKAMFDGWVNHTIKARIETWFEWLLSDEELINNFALLDHGIGYSDLDVEIEEIRLVTIQPGTVEEELELILCHTSLRDEHKIPYEALSYCWDKELRSYHVFLTRQGDPAKRQRMRIQRNLHAALLRLRQPAVARTFWIDFLSINQKNLRERNEQVALMGKIYAQAKAVRVWLGELSETHFTEDALSRYRKIATSYCSGFGSNTHSAGCAKLPLFHKGHASVCEGTSVTVFHFDRIFTRPWFQRVWVVQEVWNAQTDRATRGGLFDRVTVLCGDVELPWFVMMRASLCFYRGFIQGSHATLPALWRELFKCPSNNPGCPRSAGIAASRRDILDVLIGGLEMKSSDPRDKIFALLGFGKETWNVASLPDEIRPDYNKETTSVFVDFSLWWIEHHNSLRIFSAVHALHGRSWLKVVDTSGSIEIGRERPSWTLWTDGYSRWSRGTLALNPNCKYRACGHRDLDLELIGSDARNARSSDARKCTWGIPSFRGVLLGAIQSIEHLKKQDCSPEMWAAFVQVFDPSSSGGFWRASKQRGSWHEDDQALKRHFENHAIQDFDNNSLPCIQKCMFRMANKQIGLCPACTATDDLVVILFGGLVPFVLRPAREDGIFHFIGECYVDGVMYGEAIRDGVANQPELVFSLV